MPDEPYVLVSAPIPPGEPLPYAETRPLTADAIREAVRRVMEAPVLPPRLVIGPRMHDAACDLLDVPHGTPLTEADLWRAADIERDRLTPAQREQTDAALWQLIETLHRPW